LKNTDAVTPSSSWILQSGLATRIFHFSGRCSENVKHTSNLYA